MYGGGGVVGAQFVACIRYFVKKKTVAEYRAAGMQEKLSRMFLVCLL